METIIVNKLLLIMLIHYVDSLKVNARSYKNYFNNFFLQGVWITLKKEKVWKFISKQKLSEEFIEKYQENINWLYISEFQTLSEEFISRFKDRVNWECISFYHHYYLSEEFIEKYRDYVDISTCPTM